jgi:hypothetical protein
VGELERLMTESPTEESRISDGTVDSGAVGPNINGFLDECVRNACLKVESGQQIIREPPDCRSDDQRAEIATDDGAEAEARERTLASALTHRVNVSYTTPNRRRGSSARGGLALR